jgi:plasmid stabilization system protein ParE
VTSYRVEFSPEALGHVEQIAAWWEENRPARPALFRDELEAAVCRLETAPRGGVFYGRTRIALRRLFMPRTRYHVYYTVEETDGLVRVHAVWHASRGHAPSL